MPPPDPEPISDLLSDTKIVAALVAAIAAFLLFVLSRAWDVGKSLLKMRAARRRIVAALYSEIQNNIEDFERTLVESPTIDHRILRAFQEDKDKLVHAPYSRNLCFFEDLRSDLDTLPSHIRVKAVRFYHTVEGIYALADSFSSESFKSLTPEGKILQLEEYMEQHEKAVAEGKEVCSDLRKAYPTFLL